MAQSRKVAANKVVKEGLLDEWEILSEKVSRGMPNPRSYIPSLLKVALSHPLLEV